MAGMLPTLWLWEGTCPSLCVLEGSPLSPFPSFPRGTSPGMRLPELCWEPPQPQSHGGWGAWTKVRNISTRSLVILGDAWWDGLWDTETWGTSNL